MPLNPPSQLNQPERTNPGVFLFYGRPKIGKSSAAAQIPDSYMLVFPSSEGGGTDFIEYRGSKINSLDELEEALPTLRKWSKEERLFSRLIIDTIDGLEPMLDQRELVNYNATPSGKKEPISTSVYAMPYGKGNHVMRQAFHELLAKLCSVAPEIILIAHNRDRVLDKTVQVVESKDIDLTGRLASIVCYRADATAYMFRDQRGNTKVTFATNEQLNCGVRCSHLSGKSFEIAKMVDGKLVCDWSKIYLPEAAPAATIPPAIITTT